MLERRAKGLCHNCDEQFTLGHRWKKLFWLEVTTTEDEEDVSEADEGVHDPEISIHTLKGIKNAQTMRIQANIM